MIYRLLLPILLLLPVNLLAQINVRGDLISAPSRVSAGATFLVKIQGDLPYTVTPEPAVLTELLDRNGNVVLFLTAGTESLTVEVRHQVTHPTDAEIANTPVVTDPNDAESVRRFKEYLKAHSKDEIYQDSHRIQVGRPEPEPDPDPGPTPDPDPEPDPDNPPPIPKPGFRVMILYDDKQTLPSSQQAILTSAKVDSYLRGACVEEPDGTAGFRIYDKDADLSGELDVWKNAIQRRPESTPWVIISNGKTGTEEPLPMTPDAFIELCKKYEE